MREFKFIRGIYKNENIFNTDETKDTLFALYKNGSPVSLDIKNDEDFQKTIVDLDSDKREIYTIRPSQFNVKATGQPNDDYAFEYNLDGKFAYDGSKELPDKVKESAAHRLKENTTASIEGDPKLILSGDQKKPTLVSFTFNDRPAFEKDLYFRVSGQVNEYSIGIANDEGLTAYKIIDGNVSYKDSTTGTFHNGKKQKDAQSTPKSVATDKITVNSKGSLKVASQYLAGTDYKFLIGETQLLDNVKYEDNLTFDLYKKVTMYLTQSDADSALDEDGQINDSFVVYHRDNCPSTNCYKEESSLVKVTAYLKDKCEKGPITNDNKRYYAYYELHEEPAYILEGSCNVLPRDGIIVKDYNLSFDNLLIICTDESNKQILRPIKNEDLTPDASVEVYIGDIDSYNVFNNGVYINDPEDDADYVMLSFIGNASITNSNASINNEGDVVPKQDSSTFRQIVDNTLNIIATES